MASRLSGLPARLLRELGVRELYPTQEAALRAGILDGESVVISAPTASGKTLAAMLAAAAALEAGRGKVVYTCPLRSIAMEKYKEFAIFEKLGYNVKVSIGDYEKGMPDAPLVITTYEKLDSTIRSKPGLASGIGLLIVDEIHYVGDPKRGPILESLLAKVKVISRRLQIVALSATIPNAGEIAEWLGAKLVKVNWRPVPLYEGVYSDGVIKFYSNGREEGFKEVREATGNRILDVIIQSSSEGGHALVFVQSRRRAVQLAKQVAKKHKHLHFDEQAAREAAAEVRKLSFPSPLKEELAWLIERGVSYHHAGLGAEARVIVEEAFRSGALAAVVATPTLAAGVNLPARRVVVAEYYRFESGYRRPISVAEYKQLAGRAGRPGLDPYGEAVIIPQGSDDPLELVREYILAEPEPVTSRLSSMAAVRHSVLGLVALGAGDVEYIKKVHKETLYAKQYGSLDGVVEASLGDLAKWGLVEDLGGGKLSVTPLGEVVSRYYVDPASVGVLRLLTRVRGDPTDAQLLYIISAMPDMTRVPTGRREGDELLDRLLDIAAEVFDLMEYIGPSELSIIKTLMILWDWINEKPEDEIVQEYDVGPGDLASITETARWLAAAASAMTEVMPELPLDVSRKLRLLEKRIKYGVKPELLPLVAIPGIGRVRARRLYQHGYRLPQDLATADPKELARIPGIGPGTVASILEFLGRSGEAERYRIAEKAGRKGLLAYMED
jgi:helicase